MRALAVSGRWQASCAVRHRYVSLGRRRHGWRPRASLQEKMTQKRHGQGLLHAFYVNAPMWVVFAARALCRRALAADAPAWLTQPMHAVMLLPCMHACLLPYPHHACSMHACYHTHTMHARITHLRYSTPCRLPQHGEPCPAAGVFHPAHPFQAALARPVYRPPSP